MTQAAPSGAVLSCHPSFRLTSRRRFGRSQVMPQIDLQADNQPHSVTSGALTIRTWEPEDAPALASALKRSYSHMRPFVYWVTRNMSERRAADRIAEWRRRFAEGNDLQFAMVVGDELLGGAGFQRCLGPDPTRAELSMWVDVSHAGSGWGTLAGELLVDWGFSEWGFELLVVSHLETNVASCRATEKVGFVRSEPGRQILPRRAGVVEWHLTRQMWLDRQLTAA